MRYHELIGLLDDTFAKYRKEECSSDSKWTPYCYYKNLDDVKNDYSVCLYEQKYIMINNMKIQNVLHVFDLIKDNVINAKIGKKVAEIIFEQGGTPEDVIKNIGLRKCMPDPIAVLDIINMFPDLLHRAPER